MSYTIAHPYLFFFLYCITAYVFCHMVEHLTAAFRRK
jgi:hypothetical protein